jgi:hypothetical protein
MFVNFNLGQRTLIRITAWWNASIRSAASTLAAIVSATAHNPSLADHRPLEVGYLQRGVVREQIVCSVDYSHTGFSQSILLYAFRSLMKCPRLLLFMYNLDDSLAVSCTSRTNHSTLSPLSPVYFFYFPPSIIHGQTRRTYLMLQRRGCL